jgi:MFS family permease
MLSRFRGVYQEFPRNFWILIAASFIDRLGGALLFPFFALYITERFEVGMTEVGYLFALFAIANIGGGVLGGGMTDRFGRKWAILFGLVTSGLGSLAMGVVDDLKLFYLVAFLLGFLSSAGGPAQQAMVADLLPEEKRTEGFGIWRVVSNLAVTIGPAIGGLLALYSYLTLFIMDAVTSFIMGLIVYFSLPETKPELEEGQSEQTLGQTLMGYGAVFADRVFMAFLLLSVLSIMVYMQMNSTLSVYLRDVHGVATQGYGALLSLNAAMVVFFQFWVSRRIKERPPMLVLAVGVFFYAVGFAMYGFVGTFFLFVVAMVIITIGEMIVSPTAQALVARFAPAAMRGRYMAMYGFSWIIPTAFGPLLAGIVMDNYNPDWVWYAAGILGLVAVFGLIGLHPHSQTRFEKKAEVAPMEVGI